MVISKIKPCMSKYMCINTKPRMAHYNSYNLLDVDINPTWITVVILELIHAQKSNFYEFDAYIS